MSAKIRNQAMNTFSSYKIFLIDVKHVFLNEERLFGICKPKEKVEDETISSKSNETSSGKRSRA